VLHEILVVKQMPRLRRNHRLCPQSLTRHLVAEKWTLTQPSPSSQLNAALPQAVNVNSLADGTALPMKRMICCCEPGQLAVSAAIPAS